MGSFWVVATLIAAAAQTARNAAQALGTGEGLPALTGPSLGYAALGAIAQIAATALMLVTMKSRSFAITTAWIKTEPVLVAILATLLIGDPLTWAKFLAIGIATLGVVILSTKAETTRGMLRDWGPAATGLLAGLCFGLAAIGFRGSILALPEGSFLIRATTILVLSLALQTGILLVWLLAFDRAALLASFGVWRASLLAGFLGAFASQFWFIGFSLTSAANVRTLALVEVLMALAVSAWVFRQPVTGRQILGMTVIVAGVALLLAVQS
jgi:drug/metabolite transporter (DMT)-like permease